MDRFTRFANTWKSVGVTSRVKWQQHSTLDRFNVMLVRRLTDRYGEEAKALMEDVAYQIGLEDGEKICENLNLDRAAITSALSPLETIALLTGIDSEVSGDKKTRQFPHLSFKCGGCVFGQILDGMDRDVRERVCLKYSLGLIHSVNKEADLKVLRRCCQGNRQCEFVVTFR
ncbi:MAG: hypothetical protein A4E28_02523 [Methanocella sp. PtaU1.Bin125]|nr:MAG: hypothetical protein A4E28_02523 [Methanocella sp. PtaU1.Bin125]